MQLLYSAPALYMRERTYLGLILTSTTAKNVKKEQRQINKKFCELKGGNIGIVENAQETRFGMSWNYSRYIHWDSILESCFVSYVIVKSPSKPYIVVHLFSNVQCIYHTVVHSILASLIIVTQVKKKFCEIKGEI